VKKQRFLGEIRFKIWKRIWSL